MGKKAAKKKTEVPAGQLGDWLDEIPEEVQKAAEAYDRAHVAFGKAKAKLNTAKDNVIDAMEENDCLRCRIRNGTKLLVLDETKKVLIKKVDDKSDDEE